MLGAQPSALTRSQIMRGMSPRSLGQVEMLKSALSEERVPKELSWELSAQVRISYVGCSSFGSDISAALSSEFDALYPKLSEN